MRILPALANVAWSCTAFAAGRRFAAALREPAAAQQSRLIGYLRANANTEAGRRLGFTRILRARTPTAIVDAYRHSVPICTYDDLEPLVLRIASGEAGILTAEPVLRLAPSSGSTSAAKLVPQTAASQREFGRAVDAWMSDLFRTLPSLFGGPAYWSITPSISFEAVAAGRLRQASASRIPIGFDEDSGYLGAFRRRLVDAILAVPGDVRLVADAQAFQYLTLLFLARARDLRLMSVWHPSFLLQLLDALPAWFDRLVRDIEHGTITPPAPIPDDVARRLRRRLTASPRRAAELRRLDRLSPSQVWPALSLVSAWGDGPARSYAQRLAHAVPRAALQAKGLIATEGIVSIPFRGRHPLAVTSHFFEFLDASGRSCLVSELAAGEEYDIVLTTGGGLYRYALGDRVKVTAWIDATPSLAFVGRADGVSDRFGEKLSDGFVADALARIFASLPPPRFAMLAPETTAEGVAYTLLVDLDGPDGATPADLQPSLETALRRNPHYAWCVDLGQLRPSRVVRVGPHADRAYLDACVARGQRLGDVKPAALQRDGGWEAALGRAAS